MVGAIHFMNGMSNVNEENGEKNKSRKIIFLKLWKIYLDRILWQFNFIGCGSWQGM